MKYGTLHPGFHRIPRKLTRYLRLLRLLKKKRDEQKAMNHRASEKRSVDQALLPFWYRRRPKGIDDMMLTLRWKVVIAKEALANSKAFDSRYNPEIHYESIPLLETDTLSTFSANIIPHAEDSIRNIGRHLRDSVTPGSNLPCTELQTPLRSLSFAY